MFEFSKFANFVCYYKSIEIYNMGPNVVTKLTLQLPVPMKKDLDNLMVIFSIKSNATKIIRFFSFSWILSTYGLSHGRFKKTYKLRNDGQNDGCYCRIRQ